MVKQFEAQIGKFLWKGPFSLFRIPLDELKNKKMDGGLQVPCLAVMGRSLLISQCLRLLKISDPYYLNHVDYWLGPLLVNVKPGMGQMAHNPSDNPYFSELGYGLASIMINDFLTADSLKNLTNKQIYSHLAEFPVPKIVREAPRDRKYKPVWKLLHSRYVSSLERDLLFLIIHNKLPVIEKLFRIGPRNDPYCIQCPGALFSDVEHFFCQCEETKEAWAWIRVQLLNLIGYAGLLSSDSDLLRLFIPPTKNQGEIVWLLSRFVWYVWDKVNVNKSNVRVDKMIAFLRNRFMEDKERLSLSELRSIFLITVT